MVYQDTVTRPGPINAHRRPRSRLYLWRTIFHMFEEVSRFLSSSLKSLSQFMIHVGVDE